jgi:hypothetical protein
MRDKHGIRRKASTKAPTLRHVADIALQLADALDMLLDTPGGLAAAILVAQETREDLDAEIQALKRLLQEGKL